jgi:hypothetical protein
MSEPLKLKLSGKTRLEVTLSSTDDGAVVEKTYAWDQDVTKTIRLVDQFRDQLKQTLARDGAQENFEYLTEVQRLISEAGGPQFPSEADLEEFYDLLIDNYWAAKKKRLSSASFGPAKPTSPPSTGSTPADGETETSDS